MLPDCEGSGDECEDEEWLVPGAVGDFSMIVGAEKGEDGEGDSCGDAANRDILRREGHDEENEEEEEHGHGHEGEEGAGGRCDSFPAFKADPG